MIRRAAQAILLPVAVIGGYVLTAEAGGFVEDAWEDYGGPFLITYWIGLGFTNMWYVVRESVKDARPGVVAGTVAAVLFVLLVPLGGIAALWEDPWLFGVLIAPGFDLILPYLYQRHEQQEDAPGDPPDLTT